AGPGRWGACSCLAERPPAGPFRLLLQPAPLTPACARLSQFHVPRPFCDGEAPIRLIDVSPRASAPRWLSMFVPVGIVPEQGTSRETDMPEVYVHAVKGRSLDQKRALVKDITDAVVKNFSVPVEAVVVEIVESEPTAKAKGGVLFSEM